MYKLIDSKKNEPNELGTDLKIRSRGFSLVEMMIALGIFSIIMSSLTSYIIFLQKESKAIGQLMAKLDTEKMLTQALMDGSICTQELSNSAFNPLAPYKIDTSSPSALDKAAISLNVIHSSALPGPPAPGVLLQNGMSPSALADSVKILSMEVKNFAPTGTPNRFSAQLVVNFGGNLVRALKPIAVKTFITTNASDPASSKRIVSCSLTPGSNFSGSLAALLKSARSFERTSCIRDSTIGRKHILTVSCPPGMNLLNCIGGPGDQYEIDEGFWIIPNYNLDLCELHITQPACDFPVPFTHQKIIAICFPN